MKKYMVLLLLMLMPLNILAYSDKIIPGGQTLGIEVKNDEIYLPITQMATVYNMEMTYITDKNTLVMDSLEKELIKADVSSKVSVKYKNTVFSKTVDRVNKGSKVIVVEEKNGWSKIRTNAGKIGYVKTSKIQNKYYVNIFNKIHNVISNSKITENINSCISKVQQYNYIGIDDVQIGSSEHVNESIFNKRKTKINVLFNQENTSDMLIKCVVSAREITDILDDVINELSDYEPAIIHQDIDKKDKRKDGNKTNNNIKIILIVLACVIVLLILIIVFVLIFKHKNNKEDKKEK